MSAVLCKICGFWDEYEHFSSYLQILKFSVFGHDLFLNIHHKLVFLQNLFSEYLNLKSISFSYITSLHLLSVCLPLPQLLFLSNCLSPSLTFSLLVIRQFRRNKKLSNMKLNMNIFASLVKSNQLHEVEYM